MHRLNVDGSPLPFVVNSKIVEKGNEYQNTWISQTGREPVREPATVNDYIYTKGRCNQKDEGMAWNPNVDVYFQENMRVGTNVCDQLTDNTLKLEEEHLKNNLTHEIF